MSFVFGREESGLVMIEPPRHSLVRAVFEIDDGDCVAVQLFAVERVAGLMHRRGAGKSRVGADLRPEEFREDGRRRNAVEAIAVIKYAKFHRSDDTLVVMSPQGEQSRSVYPRFRTPRRRSWRQECRRSGAKH